MRLRVLLLAAGTTFAFLVFFSRHVLVRHTLAAVSGLLRVVHRFRAGQVLFVRLPTLRLGRHAIFIFMALAALFLERGNLAVGLVLRDAVAFLDRARQLVALPLDAAQIIVREFAPLLLHFAFELLPVALHSVPVHRLSP